MTVAVWTAGSFLCLPLPSASAAENLNCAVQAVPDYEDDKPPMVCFADFAKAVQHASGGKVDAWPWNYDPRGAVTSSEFRRLVDSSDSAQQILSIEFDHPDFRGNALVVWGDGPCTSRLEASRDWNSATESYVVRDLKNTGESFWNDTIASFVPFNGCYSEKFKSVSDDPLQLSESDLLGGGPVASNMSAAHQNSASSLAITGGLFDYDAYSRCQNSFDTPECKFIQPVSLATVQRQQDEMIGWNCTTDPVTLPYDDAAITHRSSYKIGGRVSVSTGDGTETGKIEASLDAKFRQPFANIEYSSYAKEHQIPAGHVGVLSSTLPAQELRNTLELNYRERELYHYYWHKNITAVRPADGEQIEFNFAVHPMTSSERSSKCAQSPARVVDLL
ncbi:hypothetical protein ACFZAV_43910 [Streptomyces sp. NPDC008343]|uniref:hypothetical protein n=1 Tax=Streptomyces sp. NPDC008343 TaxID=3364828 RepID=UPI0036EBB57D